MKSKIKSTVIHAALVLLSGCLFPLQFARAQSTNYFIFGTTSVASGAGPVNPASGPTTVSGSSLTAGGVVVFDGVVINTNLTTGDNWGGIELNSGGYLGLTGAQLGVLARTGDAAGNECALFGGAGGNFAGTSEVFSNRVRIELYVSTTGSTTNMGYLAEIDQGLTGTWTSSLSGTNLTFTGNAIDLQFCASDVELVFYQSPLPFLVTAPSPATATVATNRSATFSVAVSAGFNTIQCWRKNGVLIPGATNLSYTTPPAVSADNGAAFDIIVTNAFNTATVVTSGPPAILTVRSAPGIVPFNFPTTSVAAGGGSVTDPGVSISGSSLLAGDTVVFDGVITPNGSQLSDAWTSVDIAGSGYGNLFGTLGTLCRMGAGANPSQLFINGNGVTNPTTSSAATNRVRIELFVSANASTTNMGWLVEIDQNLSGTFQPAVSGTNLTFANNTLPLTFGSSGSASIVTQDPQSPVSIFSGPSPSSQVVAVGAPATVGVTVLGWSPAFQWRKNGIPIANATNEVYTLPTATLADNGDQFTVVVSNRLNSLNVITSSVATVAVLIPNNLNWYPIVSFTNWDTATANWTTNGGTSQTLFSPGQNVTFDNFGYNVPGNVVAATNSINANAVPVNPINGEVYQFTGAGAYAGQLLAVNGDNSGAALGLEGSVSFNTTTVASGAILDVGYDGTDGVFSANLITNNGTINFQDAVDVDSVPAVITGSGVINQNGTGTTVLSATNSAYTIGTISSGTLSIASTPNSGAIVNNAVLVPASAAPVLLIPNAISGSGYFDFTGFQTTIVTGESTFTGANLIFWSDVIVNNPQALGDNTGFGSTIVSGADRFGGLYLSNNITWNQNLELDTRYATGQAATAPEIANWSGTNDITSPLIFNTGTAASVSGTELNVEATTGQLTIDAASTLANNTFNTPCDLNLQGAGLGLWNAILVDSSFSPLNVLMRGTGTWVLGGANTYSGTTTVSSGTLLVNGQIGAGNVSVLTGGTLGGNGTLGGAVTVAAGGAIAPGNGLGTFTINNTLALAPGSFTSVTIDKTTAASSQVAGLSSLTYGGTLVVTNLAGTLTTSDAFKLFSSTAYAGTFAAITPAVPGPGLAWNTNTLATDGTLRIVVGIANNPTKLSASVVAGNNLQIFWPYDHLGWTLQVQTNALNVGIRTNWVNVAGSSTTNSVTVPIGARNACVFYRLIN